MSLRRLSRGLRAFEVGLLDDREGVHSVRDPIRGDVEDEHAVVAADGDEEVVPGWIERHLTIYAGESVLSDPGLVAFEVVLAEHVGRVHPRFENFGTNVPHEDPTVAAVGEEQALVIHVHHGGAASTDDV